MDVENTRYEILFGSPEKMAKNEYVRSMLCERMNDPLMLIKNCASCRFYGYGGCILKRSEVAAMAFLTEVVK